MATIRGGGRGCSKTLIQGGGNQANGLFDREESPSEKGGESMKKTEKREN